MAGGVTRRLLLAAIATGVATGSLPAQEPLPGIDVLLQRPAFKQAWDGVFRRERNIDRWVHVFGGGGEGTVLPTRAIERDGVRYLAGAVCRPQACEDNRLFVLFRDDGSQAWARWVGKDLALTYGQPTPALRALLVEVAGR
ncbi:Ivy family c-type lysozyme inhibitor [Phreatobacter sp.]|uniref:Ivy family c-type lysozyme inhibitor n=1 Tax=Phreatobacter sp. TaxID=1966341 RepID=UPI003F6EB15A